MFTFFPFKKIRLNLKLNDFSGCSYYYCYPLKYYVTIVKVISQTLHIFSSFTAVSRTGLLVSRG